MEDTEWNDILRAKGIIPQKEPEVTEEALTEMIEQTIKQKQSIGEQFLPGSIVSYTFQAVFFLIIVYNLIVKITIYTHTIDKFKQITKTLWAI